MKRKVFLIILFCFMISGCSVVMALHGKKDVSLNTLTLGQERSVILSNLGKPYSTTVNNEGNKVDHFKLQKGNEPNAGRAFFNLLMDVLSFGFWEIAATPGEAISAKEVNIKIEYDKEDKFVKLIDENTESHNLE